MNVNLQQFIRTWPSTTGRTEEGVDEEVEEEDELGGKHNNYYYDYYYNNTSK